MAGEIKQRLEELGIDLPEPPVPVANYIPWVQTGNLVFISGQVPMGPDGPRYLGKVGDSLTLEEGQEAARLCAINILAQLNVACGGDLDRVQRCLRLGGFVNCVDGFNDQPAVINGASDLMVEVFGDQGRHSRTAVGVTALPLGVSVEVDALFEVA